MLAILSAAASVVPECSVCQQQHQEHNVEVRSYVLEERWYCPEEGSRDLGKIVEVPSDAPPTRAQEQRRTIFSSSVHIRSRDVLRGLAPHLNISLALRMYTGDADGDSETIQVEKD